VCACAVSVDRLSVTPVDSMKGWERMFVLVSVWIFACVVCANRLIVTLADMMGGCEGYVCVGECVGFCVCGPHKQALRHTCGHDGRV
jgi:hypothetical protein